jgi:hypothetical protein
VYAAQPVRAIRSLYDFWHSFSWRSIKEGLPPVNAQRFAKLVTFDEFILAGNALIRRVECRKAPVAGKAVSDRTTRSGLQSWAFEVP